ncbi:heterokaryon incompatibility protein-domain-containing protein [Trametes gibbosa]|nr:heterokaryon incompatibility protein-domain-containing protein [Trametes gibbosa]
MALPAVLRRLRQFVGCALRLLAGRAIPLKLCSRPKHGSPVKPESLCQSCWNGPFGAHATWLSDLDGGSQEKKSYSYRTSGKDIKMGADMGCAWCSHMYQERKWVWPSDSEEIFAVSLEAGLHFDYGGPPEGMRMLTVRANEYVWRYAYALYTAPLTVTHAPILNVGSKRALVLAHDSLEKCKDGHERCRQLCIPPERTRLPTRFIDCTDPEHPRLVRSVTGQCGQYLTLSYVWGENQPHKTIKSNLSAYECGIDLSLLPETIRDAIRVTHELGFDKLWVDSLCIVQDDEIDKPHEIGSMHDIYRYASLTIVAASASSASEGFLRDRTPQEPDKPVEVSLPILFPPTRSTEAPRPIILTFHLMSKDVMPDYISMYTSQPISKRAWCLQEYLMSPRSLLFTSQTLQLRCQTATRSIGNAFYNWEDEPRLPDALFLHAPSPPNHSSGEWIALHQMWVNVVLDYTRRAMSQESDKLVACAAIAQGFHRVLDSDYVVGLWRHSLLVDLLWYTDWERRPRPAVFRAPSWSWAAVDGWIIMSPICGDELTVAVVVQCDVSLKDPSLPFGEVTGGSLVLRAPLLPVQCSGSGSQTERIQFNPEARMLREPRVDHEEDVPTDCMRWCDMNWWPCYDIEDEQALTSAWAIPLVIQLDNIRGLIVARTQTDVSDSAGRNSKTLYRRIGYFGGLQCDDPRENERILRPFKNKQVPEVEIELV